MNKWNQKKYEKYLSKHEHNYDNIDAPANYDSYSLSEWFVKKHELLEDNELVNNSLHRGNRIRNSKIKPWILRDYKTEINIAKNTLHKEIDPNYQRRIQSQSGFYDLHDDSFKNIQPTNEKFGYSSIRSKR